MAISWPTNLPQSPQKGYTESIGVNVIRSPMDAGPPKQRFRGKRASVLTLTFIMSTAQLADFETFAQDTLLGVKRFNFPHPRYTGQTPTVTVEVRIVPQNDGQLFQSQYIAPGYWQVSTVFEVLP